MSTANRIYNFFKRKINFSYCFCMCDDWRKGKHGIVKIMILIIPKEFCCITVKDIVLLSRQLFQIQISHFPNKGFSRYITDYEY